VKNKRKIRNWIEERRGLPMVVFSTPSAIKLS
jgi:hypothetical protein